MNVALPFAVAAALVAFAAAIVDFRKGEVPNWLTLGPLPIAVVAHAVMATPLEGAFGISGSLFAVLLSLVGAVACCIVPLAMYRFGFIGGADVKLLASLGALLSPRLGVEAELAALLFGGFFALARLSYQGRLFSTLTKNVVFVASAFGPPERRKALPEPMLDSVRLCPFLFLGTLFVVIRRFG